MNGHGPWVVVAWGLVNAALVCILAGYGGDAMVLWLYGGAAGIVGCFAAAAFLATRRRPVPVERYHRAPSGEAALYGAIGCVFGGLGFVFGYWFVPLAVPFLLLAVGLGLRHRPGQERLSPSRGR